MIRIISNKNSKVIQVFTEIGKGFFGDGFSLSKLKDQTKDFAGEVSIEINSPGGDAIEGLAMYDYLSTLSANITATIIGQCSSAATLIACAADKVLATPHARWLAHRVTIGLDGNSEDMQTMYETLRSMDNQIAAIYAKRTGKTPEAMLELMKKDTYLTAEQALNEGFINQIINTNQKQRAMANQLFLNLTEEEKEEMDALKAENAKLKSELEKLSGKMKAVKEEEEDKAAKAVVEAAITAGKFQAERRTDLVAIARKDMQAFTMLADSIPAAVKPQPTKVEPQPDPKALTPAEFQAKYQKNEFRNDAEMKQAFEQAYGRKFQ